jgi:membrane protease YdiL (CAAX protease family)
MSFSFTSRDIRQALMGLVAFALAGIPLGLWTGFLRFGPEFRPPADILVGFIGGYAFTALPEELLFRGLIQNLLAGRVRYRWLSLAVTSVIFGISHLNNGTAGFAVPNWTYAVMATLAGLAYGWVWMRTRKVSASAITHALVNCLWGMVFP